MLAEKVLAVTLDYPNAEVLLTGDLNARTKDFNEFIDQDDADFIFGEKCTHPSDEFALSQKTKDAYYPNTVIMEFLCFNCVVLLTCIL